MRKFLAIQYCVPHKVGEALWQSSVSLSHHSKHPSYSSRGNETLPIVLQDLQHVLLAIGKEKEEEQEERRREGGRRGGGGHYKTPLC